MPAITTMMECSLLLQHSICKWATTELIPFGCGKHCKGPREESDTVMSNSIMTCPKELTRPSIDQTLHLRAHLAITNATVTTAAAANGRTIFRIYLVTGDGADTQSTRKMSISKPRPPKLITKYRNG